MNTTPDIAPETIADLQALALLLRDPESTLWAEAVGMLLRARLRPQQASTPRPRPARKVAQ